MADNVLILPSADGLAVPIAADEISGVKYQRVKTVWGVDGSQVDTSATNPFPVSIRDIQAGDINIGNVDVLTVPADPFGANADAVVAAGAAGSMQAKFRRLTTDLGTLAGAITSSKYQTDVLTVPADPFGVNADAVVAAGAAGSMQAKLRRLTTDMGTLAGSVTSSRVAVDALQKTATTGGYALPSLTVSAASTNATNVKASAGQLYGWYITNSNAAARYVKFHNTAGTPTAGSGVVMSLLIPGNAAGAGTNVEFTKGIAFSTGIAFTTVTGAANTDSAAVGANDLVINLLYA